MTDSLENVFADLRQRMLWASSGMILTQDDPGDLVLKTPWNDPGNNEPAVFGAVQIKKNYVSYHLVSLYCLPPLREALVPDLQKRMQGKSCFNFRKVGRNCSMPLSG